MYRISHMLQVVEVVLQKQVQTPLDQTQVEVVQEQHLVLQVLLWVVLVVAEEVEKAHTV